MGPLSGIKVIDLTSVLMGPQATMTMGDMGAEVIKVESPEGDPMRRVPPFRNPGMGAIFLNANRNKRSLCVDLKFSAGREILHRLVKTADVLVYSMRPKAMQRLGLDYDTLSDINSALIYTGVFGYGQAGPYASRPAYDDLIQGAAGLSSLLAMNGDGPRYVPTALADRLVGIHAVGMICATLFQRARTGLGQKLDIPMFETMAGLVLGDHLGGLTYVPAVDSGGYRRLLSRFRRPFETEDGYICTLVYTDRHWQRFLAHVDELHLLDDERFATFEGRARHIDHVYEYLAGVFRRRSCAAWLEALSSLDIPVAPMHDLESLLNDPHLASSAFVTEVDHPSEGRIKMVGMGTTWSHTPAAVRRHAPRKGEHNEEVLHELGYARTEIDALVADRVLIM